MGPWRWWRVGPGAHEHLAIAHLDIDWQQAAAAARTAGTRAAGDVKDRRVMDAHDVALIRVDELTAITVERQELMWTDVDVCVQAAGPARDHQGKNLARFTPNLRPGASLLDLVETA